MVTVTTSHGLLWPEVCLTIIGSCSALLAVYQYARQRSFILLTLGGLSAAFAVATGLRICRDDCSVTQLAISSILSDAIISLLFITLIQQLGVWCSTASLKWPPHVGSICRVLTGMQCVHALFWLVGQAYLLSLVPTGINLRIMSRQLLGVGKMFIGFYMLGVWLTLLALLGFTALSAVLLRQRRTFARRYSNTRAKLVILLLSSVYMVIAMAVYAALITTTFQRTLGTLASGRVDQSVGALIGPAYADLNAWLMVLVRSCSLLTLLSLTCLHGYTTHLLAATPCSNGTVDSRTSRSLLRFPFGKAGKSSDASPNASAIHATTSDYTDISLCYDSKLDWSVHSKDSVNYPHDYPMPPPRALSPIMDIEEEDEEDGEHGAADQHRYNPLYGYRRSMGMNGQAARHGRQQVQATHIRPAMAEATQFHRSHRRSISLDSLIINIPLGLPNTYSFSAAVSAAADAVASGGTSPPTTDFPQTVRVDEEVEVASLPASPTIAPPSPLPASYQSVTLKEALQQARSRQTILRAARKYNNL